MVSLRKKGATLALVVGVSDYQDQEIRDLNYAHWDAQVFAAFLQSNAGGSLGSQQMRLLVNSQATMAAIQAGLEWVMQTARKGDRVIFYFSGHGDVETINDQEKGYLLAYDTPRNNYRLNAIDLTYLNEHLVRELSLREVQLILITDACHSGALAGEGVRGREATAAELMKRYAQEVRIMSCQPYELSLESTQWGQGRGVFSYFLVDGLKGSADLDRDQKVDLYELEHFLQDEIRQATNKKQHPDVFGGRKEQSLFSLDPALAEELKSGEKEAVQREFETLVLKNVASEEAMLNYEYFQAAIKNGMLIAPEHESAAFYYDALYADPSFKPYAGILAETLTTALLDSAQQAINAYLKTDPAELAQRDRFDQKYARFPLYLSKAAELLTPKDPRYRQTRAKQYYFEGLAWRLEGEQAGGSDSLYALALDKQRLALEQEDRAAYILNELGFLMLELDLRDSGIHHLQIALECAPTWAIPYNNLAIAFHEAGSIQEATAHYREALRLKPDFSSAYANLGNLFDEQMEPDSAEAMYRQALALSPADKNNHYNYGVLLSGWEGRQQEAEAAYRNALNLDPDYPQAAFALGLWFESVERPDSAETYYRRAMERGLGAAYQKLGELRSRSGLHQEAQALYLEALRLNPGLDRIFTQLASASSNRSAGNKRLFCPWRPYRNNLSCGKPASFFRKSPIPAPP
ncbi:MAG: caspase family protein [Haliscomenobacter sp.]|nr:caspase family protein [Haliscomenobacter sp.]